MYYIKILTRFNEIKLILDNDQFYDERLQQLLQQEYVQGVYLRWISELEYQQNTKYNKIRKLERKDKNVR